MRVKVRMKVRVRMGNGGGEWEWGVGSVAPTHVRGWFTVVHGFFTTETEFVIPFIDCSIWPNHKSE